MIERLLRLDWRFFPSHHADARLNPRKEIWRNTQEDQSSLIAQPSFVDHADRVWVRVGDVTYRDVSLQEIEREVAATPPSTGTIDITTMDIEEVAKLLAPRMEVGGVEFQLAVADQFEFARYVQQVAIENKERDAHGISGAPSSGAPSSGAHDTSGVGQTQQAIIVDGVSWININSLAATWPYNMHGWGGTTNVPWCTCFKMINDHTCITSAHCQHDGVSWITRHPITFQAGSSSPRPQIPSGCYSRTVPGGWNGSNAQFDYAVIAFRGLGGAWCTTSSYNTGWFGWNTVQNGETAIPTWVSGYPFNQLPPSSTYPTLSYDFRTATYQPSSANGLIYHRCDTEGGSSGTAIIKNWPSSDYRALGVHRGGNGGGENLGVRMTSALASWVGTFAGY